MAIAVRAHAANALTAARVLLTPVFLVAVWRASEDSMWGVGAAFAFLLIAASDVCDGPVARRYGAASRLGRVFDHVADLGFLLPALATYVCLGVTPWWVPAMIGVAFGAYVLDAWLRPATAPAGTVAGKLGHIGGVGNYVLVGVLVCDVSVGLRWLPAAAFPALYAVVAAYSGAAVAVRMLGRRTAAPGPLVAQRD